MFKSIINRLSIAVLFAALALIGLYAQDNTGSGTTRDYDNGVRIQQDPFVPVATRLAQSLQSRVQLTDDQTNDVRDIVINYYSKVRDIQGIQRAASRDMSGSGSTYPTDRTGTSGKTGTGSGNYGGSGSGSSTTGSTGRTGSDSAGHTGSSGTAMGTDQTQRAGGRSDNSEIMQSLRDNDIETNQDIEDVLNDNQKSTWLNVKTSWWQEVKQEVYNFNPASDVDHKNMDTDKNKSKKRGSGNETGSDSKSDIERR